MNCSEIAHLRMAKNAALRILPQSLTKMRSNYSCFWRSRLASASNARNPIFLLRPAYFALWAQYGRRLRYCLPACGQAAIAQLAALCSRWLCEPSCEHTRGRRGYVLASLRAYAALFAPIGRGIDGVLKLPVKRRKKAVGRGDGFRKVSFFAPIGRGIDGVLKLPGKRRKKKPPDGAAFGKSLPAAKDVIRRSC